MKRPRRQLLKLEREKGERVGYVSYRIWARKEAEEESGVQKKTRRATWYSRIGPVSQNLKRMRYATNVIDPRRVARLPGVACFPERLAYARVVIGQVLYTNISCASLFMKASLHTIRSNTSSVQTLPSQQRPGQKTHPLSYNSSLFLHSKTDFIRSDLAVAIHCQRRNVQATTLLPRATIAHFSLTS